jgi:uncharacterized membrane protein YfcA
VDPSLAVAFGFGLLIATLTAPVGVSGAVFMLPVQLSVLHVPSPAVTPTNLLYNVVAVPGALVRYRAAGRLWTTLARQLLSGTIPGVVIGAIVRLYLLPNGTVFKILISVFLLPLGVWLLAAGGRRSERSAPLATRVLVAMGFVAGLVGGVYGIGGGSLLAPALGASGAALAEVAPAALLCTFVTSCTGAATYAVIALTGHEGAGPQWVLGIACGLGGLVGGYLGAALQPHLPQRGLRLLLAVVAIGVSVAYLVDVVRR